MSRLVAFFLLIALELARPLAAQAWRPDNGDGTFNNPVIYSDFPDPDIIRVGADFYMVSTTFVNSPGINILKSRDMVHWEMIGQAASTVNGGEEFDLKNGRTAYERGFWACSLRHYKGVFYIAVQPTFGPGRIYYASNPAGPWNYHQLDRGIYDPGLFIDNDGRGYIACGHTPQSLMVLSADFSSIVEERKGWLDSSAEGCHMIRRGSYYYVFTARPGVWPFELVCWRTTTLTNPRWERRVALTAITGGHQGGVVEVDDRGNWFGFVHQDSGSIGRMPRIGPVFWEKDWPIFGTPQERDVMPKTVRKPVASQPIKSIATSDDFSGPKLGVQWTWNHNPNPAKWSLEERAGWLRLRPSKAPNLWTARNTLTQKTYGPRSNGIVRLDVSKLRPGDVAGFGVLGKTSGYAAVSVNKQGVKTLGTQVLKDKTGNFDFHPEHALAEAGVFLRTDLDYETSLARCSYSLNGRDWTPIGGPFELQFGYGSTFQGPQLAIFCYNTEVEESGGFLEVDSFTFAGDAPLASAPRGRPRLNAARTTFVADNGQLLRGPYQSTEWSDASPFNDVATMRKLGFNAIHLYAESFDPKYPAAGSTAPGYAESKIDQVVEHTRKLGLYLVITIGNGAHNGNHNKQWVLEFWKRYSARYAKESHVMFEIQNEPVAWGPPYSDPNAKPPGAVTMEVEAYKVIRQNAPDTPVLLFTYAVLAAEGSAEKVLDDIKAFNAGVGGDPRQIWSNAAVGFHGYAGHVETPRAIERLQREGYPSMMTEFIGYKWGEREGVDIELTAELERLNVSWLNFLTVPPDGVSPLVTLPEVYKDRINLTGVSWVPDFGEWPPVRRAYGNDGQPRATTEQRERGVLKGALRIESEDFDIGRNGLTYKDTNPNNNEGGAYRPNEGVDIRRITDAGPGNAVTRTADGEWLEYTVFVKEPGFYRLGLRYSAVAEGSAVRVLFYGSEKLPETKLPASGGAESWKTFEAPAFLEYGRQVVRVEIIKGGCDLNWLEITPEATPPIPSGEYVIVNRNSGLLLTPDKEDRKLKQQPASGASSQVWKLEHLGAGQYRISSVENNHYWNIDTGEGKPVNLVGWGGGADAPGRQQRCVIRPVGAGYYRITPVSVGLDFGIEKASVTAGELMTQRRYENVADQQWAIQKGDQTPAPSGMLAMRIDPKQVRVSWNAVSGATGYKLRRAEVSGGPYRTLPQVVRETSFVDWGAAKGKDYFYVVSAVGPKGESIDSSEASPGLLRAYLKFDGVKAGVAADESDHGWKGTLTGSPKTTPGVLGDAVMLDGLDDWAELPPGVVEGLEDFTIAAWIRPDGVNPLARLFDFGGEEKTYMFLTPSDREGRIRYTIRTPSGERSLAGSKPLPVNAWTHIAVTFGEKGGVLYLNGEEIGRADYITARPKDLGRTTRNYLGKSQFSSDPLLAARIDEFRVYDGVVSQAELRALASLKPPTTK